MKNNIKQYCIKTKQKKNLYLRNWDTYNEQHIYVHSNTINKVHGDPENDKVIKEDRLH